METNIRVLLAGATGLVGSECLRMLLHDPFIAQVNAMVRNPIGTASPKLKEFVVNFDEMELYPDIFKVRAIICTLGTTIKKAGSKANFQKVDYHYPLRIAKMGLQQGASHYVLVSSLNADPRSRTFYLRTKGELEEALKALGYKQLTILRPSLLLGKRKEFRLGEEIAKSFAFLIPGKYRPNPAEKVASAILNAVKYPPPKIRYISSTEINEETPEHV
ncbi:MAG TPA: NAD(P)H-binding protein [Ignavibacteriales bacterium]|nr:NAD(P)H-binding protein [Ignavibacteriales bacterium]